MTTTDESSQSTFASPSLYVGDLDGSVSEGLLYEHFSRVGPVASVRVCRDAATRRSLGYAYVNFVRMQEAERALRELNWSEIKGRPCRIMWAVRDPSLRKSGVGNLFVKNLPKSVDSKALFDMFSPFGSILSCKVATDAKGDNLGYGFVHFETAEAATAAIESVNGKEMEDCVVTVEHFKSRKERSPPSEGFTNLYVKSFPDEWTEKELTEAFAKFGTVTSCLLVPGDAKETKGPKTGGKGFGFVNMGSHEEALAAIDGLNNTDVAEDRKLYVGRAQRREERQRELRRQFAERRMERMKKLAGVNLCVRGLPKSWDEDRLRTEFSPFGSIEHAKVVRDRETKESRGFGFVCYSNPEEATKAVTEMNNKDVEDERKLGVALADTRRGPGGERGGRRGGRGWRGRRRFNDYGGGMGHYQFPHHFFPGPYGYPMYMPHGFHPGMQAAPMGMRGPWPLPWAPQHQQHPQQPGAFRGGRGGHRGGRGGPRHGVPAGPGGPAPAPYGPPAPHMRYADTVRNMPAPEESAVGEEGGMPPAAAAPGPLTLAQLAAAPDHQRKQMIGEQLFLQIAQMEHQDVAAKITGMLLEMETSDLLQLFDSRAALAEKVSEAKAVLEEAQLDLASHDGAANAAE